MYSVSFAIAIIFCIAVTNLFLGFSAALLVGRGPRRIAHFSPALVLRRFSLKCLPRWFRRRKETPLLAGTAVQPDDAAANKPTSDSARAQSRAQSVVDSPVKRESTEPNKAASNSEIPASPVAATPAANILHSPETNSVIKLPCDSTPNDDRPAETILAQQLLEQPAADDPTCHPSATMMFLERADANLDDPTWSKTLAAVQQVIRGQLRRDRQVLQFDPGEFVWFTGDTPVDEALLPAERIRQLLTNTQFESANQPIPIHVASAVVSATTGDGPDQVLARLRQAIQFARMQASDNTAIDWGDGPETAEPLDLEVAPRSVDVDDAAV